MWREFSEAKREPEKLTIALVLDLLDTFKLFMVYCNTSKQVLEWVLMQDENVVPYASRQLKIGEKDNLTHDF